MGRALQDKDFAHFQDEVLAEEPGFKDLSVQFETIRGEKISFGWEDPWRLDGNQLSLESEKHYDSLFGVADFPPAKMEIQFGDRLLRLDLSDPGEGGDVS